MLSFTRASSLEIDIDDSIKQRERNLLAFCHQSTIRPEPFYFNPTKILIAGLSFRCVFSMWKDIAKLPDNQSSFLLRLSMIDEITITNEFAIARSRNGLCAVYKLSDRSFVGFLNQLNQEVIKSIFVNDFDKSAVDQDDCKIIKAVCLKEDNFSRVRCFSTSIKNMTVSKEIFENENISYPGFVEFDSINGRGIVLNGNLTYSIYNLKDFSLEKRINDSNIRDVKFVPELLIVTKNLDQIKYSDLTGQGNCSSGQIGFGNDDEISTSEDDDLNPFECILLDFHSFDGKMCTIQLKLIKGKEIQFIDCLDSNIVIKQVGYNARVYEAGTQSFKEIPSTSQLKITDFLFLYRARKFFVHRNGEFEVFSFSGEFIFSITSPSSKRSLDPSPAAVSRSQEFLATCSHAGFDQWIHIFSLKDGSLCYTKKIRPTQSNGYKITAIAFDEKSCTLIIGDEGGRITFYQ